MNSLERNSAKRNLVDDRRRRAQLAVLCYFCIVSVASFSSSVPFTGAMFGRTRATSALLAGERKTDLEGSSRRPQTNNPSEKRKQKDRRFSQTVHQQHQNNKQERISRPTTNNSNPKLKSSSSSSQFNPDRMWRNNKSIEDMEERLTARWGTELTRWTARDDDDDDEDDDENDPASHVAGEAPVFRARPVRDPWETSGEQQRLTHHTSFLAKDNDDDNKDKASMLARRALKNQQRLQAAKHSSSTSSSKPDLTDEKHDDGVGVHEPRCEQKKKVTRRDSLVVHDLIAPKPVGGQGTLQRQNAPPPAAGQDIFFFSQGPVGATDSEDQTAKNQDRPEKRERRLRAPSIPILDEDGKPIFLTLEQAERDFSGFLQASGETAMNSNTEDYRYQPTEAQSWNEIGITSPLLLENLRNMGCKRPLSVQVKACSSVVQGIDALVGTYTGSGKTLSFLAPLAQRIVTEGLDVNTLQVLIIAPGRELASQIVAVARDLLQGTGVSVMLAIGGTGFESNLEQIRKRKPTILVGTPGRLAELVVGRPGERGGRLKFSSLQTLVLDEFDALLEYKPHRDPTSAIIECLQQRRGERLQTVLCSATASDMLGSSKLETYLRQGYAVAMADDDDLLVTSVDHGGRGKSQAARVSRTVMHGVVHVPHRRYALETLRRILHSEPLAQQILIFAENSRKVDIIVEKLEDMGVIAASLHGGMRSEKMDRAEVSKALREGYVGIVVATELAARGLDAPLLTHVINLDLPTDASHYAHRAGRCGRGGRPGVVINITTTPQERNVPQKFADKLGIKMHAVEPRNGKLNIVDPSSQDID